MIRFVLVASLLAGCRVSLESTDNSDNVTGRTCTVTTTSAPCLDAVNHSDLAWIEANVFKGCIFSGCHNGDNTKAGKIDLRATKSFAHLVNYASVIDPARMLVVPNDIQASYLMLMIRDVAPAMATPPAKAPPGDIGFMPQGTTTALCCQKMDALEHWIMAGAQSM